MVVRRPCRGKYVASHVPSPPTGSTPIPPSLLDIPRAGTVRVHAYERERESWVFEIASVEVNFEPRSGIGVNTRQSKGMKAARDKSKAIPEYVKELSGEKQGECSPRRRGSCRRRRSFY